MIFRRNVKSKKKTEYRSLKTKTYKLNERPSYLDSMSDNPSYTRLDGGIDVGGDMFKISETLIKTINITDDTKPGELTIEHGLGYKPYATGTYRIVEDNTTFGSPYPVDLRGSIPETRVAQYGAAADHSVRVSETTNNSITIRFSLTSFKGTIEAKVHILREPVL